jgi:hypothetical protein
MKTLEDYIEKAVQNITEDRATTKVLLMDLMKWMQLAEERQKEVGIIAAKYLETLQRSNEQLVKISGLIQKESKGEQSISEKEREDLFDMIQESESDAN